MKRSEIGRNEDVNNVEEDKKSREKGLEQKFNIFTKSGKQIQSSIFLLFLSVIDHAK